MDYRNELVHSHNFLFEKDKTSIIKYIKPMLEIIKLIYRDQEDQLNTILHKFCEEVINFNLLEENTYECMKKVFDDKFVSINDEEYLKQWLEYSK